MRRDTCSLALQERRKNLVAFVASVFAATVLASCGGGNPVHASNDGPGHIVGLVVLSGPVATASITAYRLDATMTRGATLASGTTKADGTFDITVPPYSGHVELVVDSGTYYDQAANLSVQLTRELSFVVTSFAAGSTRTVTVSPVSSVAHTIAHARVAAGAPLATADGESWDHVNAHFGKIDWRAIVPTNLTPGTSVNVTMSAATKAGLVLCGLSQEARSIAEASGLSPGTSVTACSLSGALQDDAADGTVDGLSSITTVALGTVPFTPQTFRGDLAEAVLDFVNSSANKTNLKGSDIWSIATAMATNNDPYLFCPGGIACVTLLPPAPALRTGIATYHDERNLSLANAGVPPAYEFPPGAPLVDPLAEGIYKAASRLQWTTQPTADVLEGTNPDNVPYVQIKLPVGGSQLPLSTITFAIDDGTTRYTGSLDSWKSSQSTITSTYYDVPIIGNIVYSLTGAGPSPRTLDIYVTAADVNGTIASNIHVGSVAFHIVGPPLYVAEDANYPTYLNNRGTFGYSIGAHNYDQLWSAGNTFFTNGQVRLVRYVVSNPAPYAIAMAPDVQTTGTQGWYMTEVWQRFSGGNVGTTTSLDGTSFSTVYCECYAFCDVNYWCQIPFTNPWGSHSTKPFGHLVGTTGKAWTSPTSTLPDYSGTQTPFATDASYTSAIGSQLFAPSGSAGEETTDPTITDTYPVVPAAYGSTPGQLVLYVVRPVATPRTYPGLTWNLFTTNNRYEALENVAYYLSGLGGSAIYQWQQYRGAVNLQTTSEKLSGTLTITTRGLSGAFAVGEPSTAFTKSINKPSLSTH